MEQIIDNSTTTTIDTPVTLTAILTPEESLSISKQVETVLDPIPDVLKKGTAAQINTVISTIIQEAHKTIDTREKIGTVVRLIQMMLEAYQRTGESLSGVTSSSLDYYASVEEDAETKESSLHLNQNGRTFSLSVTDFARLRYQCSKFHTDQFKDLMDFFGIEYKREDQSIAA